MLETVLFFALYSKNCHER